jgi:hypothetical protein
VLLAGSIESARSAAETTPYPAMAPLALYLDDGDTDEITLARSAAPASISANADVLILGSHGYTTAKKGTNGFVCMIERSWAKGLSDSDFWNPRFRAPTCYNAAAARSILPRYLERTGWVLSGVSRTEIMARLKAEISANKFVLPEVGAMAYMMSKQTHLSDTDGHWHPHVMFYLANTEAAAWGANITGSPIFADTSPILSQEGSPEPMTIFFVLLPKWSDGTAETMQSH